MDTHLQGSASSSTQASSNMSATSVAQPASSGSAPPAPSAACTHRAAEAQCQWALTGREPLSAAVRLHVCEVFSIMHACMNGCAEGMHACKGLKLNWPCCHAGRGRQAHLGQLRQHAQHASRVWEVQRCRQRQASTVSRTALPAGPCSPALTHASVQRAPPAAQPHTCAHAFKPWRPVHRRRGQQPAAGIQELPLVVSGRSVHSSGGRHHQRQQHAQHAQQVLVLGPLRTCTVGG